MKKPMILIAALAATASLVQAAGSPKVAAAAEPAPKAHVLSRPELEKLLASPDKVLVIDVRRPDEVSSIGGFPVYLSVQIKELEGSLKWIPHGRDIVTVSNHAGRAAKAADLLASHGFKVAGAAGVQTFEQQGGKVTHIAVPPPAVANSAANTAAAH